MNSGAASRSVSAWLALADLKTFRFAPEDLEAMQAEFDRDGLPEEQRALNQEAVLRRLSRHREAVHSILLTSSTRIARRARAWDTRARS